MPVKYHDNVPTLLRGIISFSPRSCHLFPTCSPETASWLTGRYCLSPEDLPRAPHGGEPATIDSIISKRQKPPLWEPGGSFCFNEAKVASTFVCAWLQSDSDLSQAESKFRTLLRNHVSLPTSLWWMLSPHQISFQWLPQRDLCCFPKSKSHSIHSSKSLEFSPSPPILSWTGHMEKKYRQVLFLQLNLGSVPCFSGINWILKITI